MFSFVCGLFVLTWTRVCAGHQFVCMGSLWLFVQIRNIDLRNCFYLYLSKPQRVLRPWKWKLQINSAASTEIAMEKERKTAHLRFSEGEEEGSFIHTVMEVSADALQRGMEESRVGAMNNSAAPPQWALDTHPPLHKPQSQRTQNWSTAQAALHMYTGPHHCGGALMEVWGLQVRDIFENPRLRLLKQRLSVTMKKLIKFPS